VGRKTKSRVTVRARLSRDDNAVGLTLISIEDSLYSSLSAVGYGDSADNTVEEN